MASRLVPDQRSAVLAQIHRRLRITGHRHIDIAPLPIRVVAGQHGRKENHLGEIRAEPRRRPEHGLVIGVRIPAGLVPHRVVVEIRQGQRPHRRVLQIDHHQRRGRLGVARHHRVIPVPPELVRPANAVEFGIGSDITDFPGIGTVDADRAAAGKAAVHPQRTHVDQRTVFEQQDGIVARPREPGGKVPPVRRRLRRHAGLAGNKLRHRRPRGGIPRAAIRAGRLPSGAGPRLDTDWSGGRGSGPG